MPQHKRVEEGEPVSVGRRWLCGIAGGVVGLCVLLWFRSSGEQVPAPRPLPKPTATAGGPAYQLLDRSWSDLPAPEPADEADAEALRLQAMRARQWENMDISIQDDR